MGQHQNSNIFIRLKKFMETGGLKSFLNNLVLLTTNYTVITFFFGSFQKQSFQLSAFLSLKEELCFPVNSVISAKVC